MQYIHQERCGVRFTLTGPISAMFNSLPSQATRYNYTSDKKYALVEVSRVALSETQSDVCLLCIRMFIYLTVCVCVCVCV